MCLPFLALLSFYGNKQTKFIRYDNIEAICLLLDCTPNELFVIDFENG